MKRFLAEKVTFQIVFMVYNENFLLIETNVIIFTIRLLYIFIHFFSFYYQSTGFSDNFYKIIGNHPRIEGNYA